MNYNQTYLAKEDLQMKLEGKIDSLELNKIISAYEMADNAYNDMQLPDGTPHFFHCTRVCNIIISELDLFDSDLICAALLHKIYAAEDEISREIIDLNFGPYVAFLVETLKDEYKFIKDNPFKVEDDNKLRIPADDYLIIWLADHLDTFRCLDYGVRMNPIKYIKETEKLLFGIAEDSNNHSIVYLLNELKKERNKILG